MHISVCVVDGTNASIVTIIVGSCVAAGFSACCEDEDCRGSTQTCFCDELCHVVGDCCEDIDNTCPKPGTLYIRYKCI